jgi:hypothetical protein
VSIALHAGWNLIGQPFIKAVTWDLAAITVQRPGVAAVPLGKATGLVNPYAWGWMQNADDPRTGAYYLVHDPAIYPDAVGQLEPWRAYWIKSSVECSLVLPAP